jgi:hypothetical protein
VQPTPLRVEQDRRDFMCYHVPKAFPTYDGSAADAQALGPDAFLPREISSLNLDRCFFRISALLLEEPIYQPLQPLMQPLSQPVTPLLSASALYWSRSVKRQHFS